MVFVSLLASSICSKYSDLDKISGTPTHYTRSKNDLKSLDLRTCLCDFDAVVFRNGDEEVQPDLDSGGSNREIG